MYRPSPNRSSIVEFEADFHAIIQKEIEKRRYIGPFKAEVLEHLIGPFQTSPLSIILKPRKPGKFCIIQNFSFLQSPSTLFSNPSLNSCIDANNFPTTWGKFSIMYQLIATLPPGLEAATCDIAEAYQTVPLYPSQWLADVVCISDSEFCADTCTTFSATPSVGAYGHIIDAGTEIFGH